jgi:hypothetical protein
MIMNVNARRAGRLTLALGFVLRRSNDGTSNDPGGETAVSGSLPEP